MNIKELSISQLHEYDNNPRNNDGAVDAVAASIREFGFKVPGSLTAIMLLSRVILVSKRHENSV